MIDAAALGAEHRVVPLLSRAPPQSEQLPTVGSRLPAQVDLAAEPELHILLATPVPAEVEGDAPPDMAAHPLLQQVFVVAPLAALASASA